MRIKIPKKILAALDYLIMFDPVSLILVILVTLAGYATQQMVIVDNPPWWITECNVTTFLIFAAIFLVAGGIFILNQVHFF